MHNRTRLLVLLSLALAWSCGCGSDDGGVGDDASAEDASGSADATAADGGPGDDDDDDDTEDAATGDGSVVADAGESDGGVAPDPRAMLFMRIHAIRTTDDDGGRAANITAEQVAAWVAEANLVYATSRVTFEFDPANDFETLASTLLNTLNNSGANFGDQIVAGNAIAAEHPGEMVVFFRHGPSAGATGNGFSYVDIDFIAMPGFYDTGVCGHQNITIFAHEAGHYLGLYHSFSHADADDAAATAVLAAAGGSLTAFEGDSMLDNGVDPYIDSHQCDGTTEVTLAGQVIGIGRDDIMSYYDSTAKTLSPQQADVVRQVLTIRRDLGVSALLETAAPATVVEAESLIGGAVGSPLSGPQGMAPFGGKWSNGSQLFWPGGNGASLTLTLPAVGPGSWHLYGIFTAAPDFGHLAVTVDGTVALPELELYGGAVQHRGPIDLGTWPTAPTTVGITVLGKHPSSTGFKAGIDAFLLVPETEL